MLERLFSPSSSPKNAYETLHNTQSDSPRSSSGSNLVRPIANAIIGLARSFTKQHNNKSASSSPVATPSPERNGNTHRMQVAKFPSSASSARKPVFPFQVKHTFSGGLSGSARAPNIQSLWPQLKSSLSNKQGFVYIRDSAGPSPVDAFVKSFQKTGSLQLGDDCTLIGAYVPEDRSAFSSNWVFQVYDRNLGLSFDVPVSEVPFNDLINPNNRTAQLIKLNDCMDWHLRALPDAFKDSPECPAIVCPQLPRLAQLLTAQEECLGRQYRGELNCRQSIDWICAAEKLLGTISPESPRFQGEESCDFESFFLGKGVHHIGLYPLSFSIGLEQRQIIEGAIIRGYKRHLIHNTKPQAAAINPGNQNTTPDWLESRNRSCAYKEPSRQMQCSSNAINGLFQQHVVTPEMAASHVISNRLTLLQHMYSESGNNWFAVNQQKGLMHPKILTAILNGNSVTITKQEFIGEDPSMLDFTSEKIVGDTWRELVNASPYAVGKNWIEHEEELTRIESLTITPEIWISSQRGMELPLVQSLLNQQLEQHPKDRLPTKMVHWDMKDHQQDVHQLEAMARTALQNGKDFPILIRTGGVSGHYQTIVPTAQGNWLTLNSNGTRIQGIQPCDEWCRAGLLAQTILAIKNANILVPDYSN